MNAVEIEEAVCELVEAPFDAAEFPYQFLEAFGNKATTIKRLRKGTSNHSDLVDINGAGVLQTSNIHLATCPPGEVGATLTALRESPATLSKKCKFILATDGEFVEAENVGPGGDGETLACELKKLPDRFAFFLELAGIKTVRAIRENAFDVKATGRLNKLYVELLKENPDWGSADRREELNHFFARLIFCFFAEDTSIFHGEGLFTKTIEQMTARDASDTHDVLAEVFRAMDTRERKTADLRPFAQQFPYVNGGLFGDCVDGTSVPRFSKIARSYLIHIGNLDWTKINPDIFGSMIQAVADDEERGALGMHYTSVPNILKVLNPLFLDDLHEKLDKAGDRPQALRHLRRRLSRIRVFDPACGSGNFLVIAYKQMRQIEATINERLGESHRVSDIPLTNFRGIELRSFAAEVARLALIIAEYQCDKEHRGEKLALAEFLPLDSRNWITCGNALRLDWLKICPPTGTGVKVAADDLFSTPLDQTEMDFENEGGETFICGNPPYRGSTWQTDDQKGELKAVCDGRLPSWKSLDFVAAWFIKAHDYACVVTAESAFVATKSICQGQQVPILWPLLLSGHRCISFAYDSFKWANLASHNAGVTVVVVGFGLPSRSAKRLFTHDPDGSVDVKVVPNINPYLVPAGNVIVEKRSHPISQIEEMTFGSKPVDGGHLIGERSQFEVEGLLSEQTHEIVRPMYASKDFVSSRPRYCLWIPDEAAQHAQENPAVKVRLDAVRKMRLASKKVATRAGAEHPHRFDERRQEGSETLIVVAAITSQNRQYLPSGLLAAGTIINNKCFAIFDAPLFHLSLIASRLHCAWIGTVCVRMRTDYSYSNTLGWNTFPVPSLTDQNKADLTRCAEDILLAREAHWPATIADMYVPEAMDRDYPDLRAAHDRNDETLERIYLGRRFKNDTERLEKLFEMYTKMTAEESDSKPARKTRSKR